MSENRRVRLIVAGLFGEARLPVVSVTLDEEEIATKAPSIELLREQLLNGSGRNLKRGEFNELIWAAEQANLPEEDRQFMLLVSVLRLPVTVAVRMVQAPIGLGITITVHGLPINEDLPIFSMGQLLSMLHSLVDDGVLSEADALSILVAYVDLKGGPNFDSDDDAFVVPTL